jgi:hypothetical protein
MAVEYRRRERNQTWHWCRNCPDWPENGRYISKQGKPTSGSLHDRCLSLDEGGGCDSR